MRILVTGGAGFIGSHVTEAYLAAGHQVSILDNLSTGKQGNIPHAATFYRGDVTDPVRVREVLAEVQPEIVNHHAAQVSVVHSVAHPEEDAHLNVVGTVTLLEAVRNQEGVEKIIYVSSGGAMYGPQEQIPIPEEAVPQALSPYALSKYVGEQYVWLYARLHGLKATVLRYANVYGPRQDPHGEAGVCAIFTGKMLAGEPAKIFGDGRHERDYVYVVDVATANVAALEKGDGHAYNIGTGIGTSTEQVFRAIAKATEYVHEPAWAPERPGEMQKSILAVGRADDELGWSAVTSLDEGIAATVASERRVHG